MMAMYLIGAFFLVAGIWVVGLLLYVLTAGDEAPEGFEMDVEHNEDGTEQTPPKLWFTWLAEGLWSRPAAYIRKMLGLPQK